MTNNVLVLLSGRAMVLPLAPKSGLIYYGVMGSGRGGGGGGESDPTYKKIWNKERFRKNLCCSLIAYIKSVVRLN